MNNLISKIQEKIKTSKIKPRPKWQFTLIAILTWVLLLVLVVILGLSLGLFIELLIKHDIPGYQRFTSFLQAIPYFWILIIGLVAIILVFKFRKTRKGYKIKLSYIIFGLIVLTIFVGFLTYYAGIARDLELVLENNAPGYGKVVRLPQDVWFSPESGNLYGEILKIDSAQQFILLDREDGIWIVYLTSETMSSPRIVFYPGLEVKIRGEVIDDYEFEAFEIRPGFDTRPKGAKPFCLQGGCR